MGCDIHFVIEKQHEDFGWVGVYSSGADATPRNQTYGKGEPSFNYPKMKSRNYQFFGALAGVRGRVDREPNGLPEDPSELTHMDTDHWGEDGHSHGHCSLLHFVRTRYLNDHAAEDVMREALKGDALDELALKTYLEFPPEDPEKYRVVFWFDN